MNSSKSKIFDVIIVGAGPAGGQCARNLARAGKKVLLIERSKTFEESNFSSAGMMLEIIEKFNLPESVIGSYWNRFLIESSTRNYEWSSIENKGVVLDFARLKQFLADECRAHGGEVLMGHRYLRKVQNKSTVSIFVKNTFDNQELEFEAKLVIDATGPARKVMFDEGEKEPEMTVASAIEYLIEVPQDVYDKNKKTLIFFMGSKWADEGYSWIFPMENNMLKVGSGKVFFEKKKSTSSKILTEKIIKEYLGLDEYKLLDSHGGVYRYSMGLKDVFFKNNVLAIGDAVSTVNPLGGEGIKFAMENADLATPFILKYLKNGKNVFPKFRKAFRRKYLFKWFFCETVAKRVYNTYDDAKLDLRLGQHHANISFDDFLDILFRFKFKKQIPRILWNLIKGKLKGNK
jgi:digeranylgeranylglycerophospholipid reductase